MRKIIITIICVTFIHTICNSQEKLNINTTKSTIQWIGEYTFYFGGHDGFINFKDGYFIKNNNVITGGEFVIDMNSITNTDIESEKANKSLVAHLKDPDFFDTSKHPLGKLVITKVEYYENDEGRFYANLTLKGITKSIKFNVKFNYPEKELKAKFKIDRTDWNINYKSKVKDGAISDAIGFIVSIKL
ncbi:YceI family protein [Tenacibaculum aquimarinum]|uniref:YceI family protein n=1 Tax=Tenacibaculum aquimarinum TaxID=2910675 RepID=UPI001F0B077C|nr:YceI family protein [Tenacibaculum aquimarinum]MCH3884586.1 YceI family protein [Tenacibaculum aquimarinum]